ncbi:uncharacterized protein LOC123319117 [Coccinella septempunctata]|uniref:uncharacterized protein LOC123319117 n=1 Tax=Coccinella septempunctata TaxID=41139 RepID=UPI001D07B63B|nr:uncharacterized protein LOC123319117 [Coccinella septempunctata]
MMFFRVKIVYLMLFQGFCYVNCSIIGSAKQNVNSIISRDEKWKNSTAQGHITVNTDGSSNTIDNKIHTRKPNQSIIPVRPIHDEKLSTPIVHHILPNITQQLATNLNANQQPPKLTKKVHHHLTVEELRQRRKELREKWQARHNILSHPPPHGLLIQSQDPIKAGPKRFEIPHVMKKTISKSHSTEEHIKKNLLVENTHPKKIASLYEPITPRTRRILEHKDEAGVLDSSKPKYLLSARTNSRTTLLNKNIRTENPPEVPSGKNKVDEGSLISTQDIKYSTESPFKSNYVNYPFMPDPMIAPMYYWPTGASTPSSTTSLNPSTTNQDEKPSTESDFKPNYVNYPFMPDPQIAPMYYWPMGASTPSSTTSLNPSTTNRDEKHSTESNFKPNYVNYPFMPDPQIAPMYYWPMSATTSLSSTSVNRKDTSSDSTTPSSGVTKNEVMDKFSAITKSPISSSPSSERPENSKLLEEQISRASNKRQGDIRPFGHGPFVETVVSPIIPNFAFQATTASSLNIFDFKLGALAEKITTNVPGPIIDDVVSVKIEPSIFDAEGYTTGKTDTASFHKNLTHHEKLPYQKPGFGYGKSSEQVGSTNPHPAISNEQAAIKTDTQSFYTNLRDKKKIALQNPLGDREKSEGQIVVTEKSLEVDNSLTDIKLTHEINSEKRSEEKLESEEHSVGNETDSHSPVRHGKRSSEHTTSSPGGSAMKIAEETHVHQDWRENLRRAIKERLLKLSSDNETYNCF